VGTVVSDKMDKTVVVRVDHRRNDNSGQWRADRRNRIDFESRHGQTLRQFVSRQRGADPFA
jgi:ribosomal protein S17